MLYFAYGSNMNWNDLDMWCRKHGYPSIHPASNTETGVIKDYRLIFNHWSRSRGGGALNIIRSSGDEVGGVLFALSDEDFEKIKTKEGASYKQHLVNVVLADNRVVGAKTFKAENNRKLFPPTDEYLNIVLIGANQFNLGVRYLEQIVKASQQARASST